MERRAFIKTGCGFCAGLAAVGIASAVLDGCKPADMIFKAEAADGKILVPSGMLTDKKFLVVRNQQLEYDLLLVKESENTYHVLAMQCTHRQQPLVVTSTGLICNEHGSRFDLDGNVTRDPATRPLRKFKAELSENNIVIHLF